jgi:hypothetical protein
LTQLLQLFSDNLLPVFLVAGAGYLLGRFTGIETRSLSRTIFYIFTPSLIFKLLSQSQLDSAVLLRMGTFTAAGLLAMIILAALAARILKLERRMGIAVMLCALLPNAGNFGLSVNMFAFGEPALAQASIFFVSQAILANTVGVYIASLGRSNAKEALLGLLKLPSIYSIVLGLLVVRFDWQVPVGIERATSLLGDASIPAMLVLLGLNLREANWRGRLKPLLAANVLRLVASPILAVALALALGLTGVARQAGILEMAMPAAVMANVLATEFDVEPAFVTSVVFTSTLLSPLTLTPLLAFLGA